MRIEKRRIGTTQGHAAQGPRDAHAYLLISANGVCLTVWTYGATLTELRVPDEDGVVDNVVVPLSDLRSYEDRARNPYVGATIGRYARSIKGGRLVVAERTYQLDLNEGADHVHGGSIGWDRFVWDANAGVDPGGHSAWVTLSLERPDGEQGYPGAVRAQTTYRLDARGQLRMEHRATTTAPTVVAMTNHTYWNLRGHGGIDGHTLRLNSARVVKHGDVLEQPVPVKGTDLDFSRERPLLESRIDNCFVLDDPTWAAILKDPDSGRTMRIETDQPGLAVYTGDGHGMQRRGICLQTGTWPDSTSRPSCPSPRLDPGETYVHNTIHAFATQ